MFFDFSLFDNGKLLKTVINSHGLMNSKKIHWSSPPFTLSLSKDTLMRFDQLSANGV
jgi:hypothetical protein